MSLDMQSLPPHCCCGTDIRVRGRTYLHTAKHIVVHGTGNGRTLSAGSGATILSTTRHFQQEWDSHSVNEGGKLDVAWMGGVVGAGVCVGITVVSIAVG